MAYMLQLSLLNYIIIKVVIKFPTLPEIPRKSFVAGFKISYSEHYCLILTWIG